MTIVRVEHHQRDFTPISNQVLRDKRLSLRARGLHHLLLSYPENWQINTDHLTEQSDKDGKTAIASSLKELEAAGYMTCQMIRDEHGRFKGWEKIIRELPIPDGEALSPAIAKPVSGKTVSGKTVAGKSRSGKTVSGKTVAGKARSGKTVSGKTSDGKPVAGKCDRIINTYRKEILKEEVSILSPTPLAANEGEENQERELEPDFLNFEDPEPKQELIASLSIEPKDNSQEQQVSGKDKCSAVVAQKDPFFTEPYDPQSRSRPRKKNEVFANQGELDNFYLSLLKYAQQAGKSSPVGYAHTIVESLQNPKGESDLQAPNLFLIEFRAGLPLGSSLQEPWEEFPGVPKRIVIQALEDKFFHERPGATPEQAALNTGKALADKNQMRRLWEAIQRQINRVAEQAVKNQALGVQSLPTLPYMTEREQIPAEITMQQLQQLQQKQSAQLTASNAVSHVIAPSSIGAVAVLPPVSVEEWRREASYCAGFLGIPKLKDTGSERLETLIKKFKLDDRLDILKYLQGFSIPAQIWVEENLEKFGFELENGKIEYQF